LYDGNLQDDLMTVMEKGVARSIAKVSRPSKIFCPAWGIPVSRCRIGKLLQGVEGSICGSCYANKRRFNFSNVQGVLEHNYTGLKSPLWVPAMIFNIRTKAEKYFRLFHSGDLQSVEHLENICLVAENVSNHILWMPTREIKMLQELDREIPENLKIRVSATMIDGEPPDYPLTSTVYSEAPGEGSFVCPAKTQDNQCQDCRACVDEEVSNVAYHLR